MADDRQQTIERLWTVIAGDLDEPGMVRTLEQHGKLLSRLVTTVFGDGNGTKGLTTQVHDLQGSNSRLLHWAKYVGVMVTTTFIAVLGYLLKWWASGVGGA
jgi:hypothetical protein